MGSSEKEMDFMGVWVGLKRKKRLWLKWRLIDAVVGLVGAFSLSKGYGATTIVVPNLSAAMLRRALFEKQGGLSSDYLVLADWDFWLKTTLECDFYYLREPLNNFRQHQTTIRGLFSLALPRWFSLGRFISGKAKKLGSRPCFLCWVSHLGMIRSFLCLQ